MTPESLLTVIAQIAATFALVQQLDFQREEYSDDTSLRGDRPEPHAANTTDQQKQI